jgi:hypothetical protein
MFVFHTNVNTGVELLNTHSTSARLRHTMHTDWDWGAYSQVGPSRSTGCSFHVNTYAHANYSSQRNGFPLRMTYLIYTHTYTYILWCNECDESDGFNQQLEPCTRSCLFDDPCRTLVIWPSCFEFMCLWIFVKSGLSKTFITITNSVEFVTYCKIIKLSHLLKR